MSLLPDFTIAQAAQEFYDKKKLGHTHTISIRDYENLVRRLLNERSESYNIALFIDALNECDPSRDAEGLCVFISEIVSENPQVRVLFSSHEQLSGSEHLKEHLAKMEVVTPTLGDELEDSMKTEIKFRQAELEGFIKTEIKFRQAKLKDSESIFRK